MNISTFFEFLGITGIFVGILLPIMGAFRSLFKNRHHTTMSSRKIRFYIAYSFFIIVFLFITSFLLLTRFKNSDGYLNLLIGIITTIIGSIAFIYQTQNTKLLTAAAEKNSEDDADYTDKYLKKMALDPVLTGLQILTMSYPLSLTAIYVHVKLFHRPASNTTTDTSVENNRNDTSMEECLDPEKAIFQYKYSLIAGDPGSGKTTLLKYIALRLFAGDSQSIRFLSLPIYLSLHAYARSGEPNLLDFTTNKWNEAYGFPKDEARMYLEKQLEAGKALFLLDGLDETFIGTTMDEARSSYKHVADAILHLKQTYQHTTSRIIVTVRKAFYQEKPLLDGFSELELHRFSQKDIKQFVDSWFAAQNSNPQWHIQATDLNTKLNMNKSIQELAATPLLLSLIAIVYEANLRLPNRRAELYAQCTEMLLKRWDATRAIHRHSELSLEDQRQLLEEVAWSLHEKGYSYFPHKNLQTVVERFLHTKKLQLDSNLIITEITTESGLLLEQDSKRYAFLHSSLQEYFVAQYAQRQQRLETLIEHRRDPRWQEVILLYASSTNDINHLLQQLLRENNNNWEEELFHTSLLLSGRCLAQSPTSQIPLREEILSSLVAILQTTRYSLTRLQAAEVLVEIGGDDVNALLLDLLSNENSDPNVSQCIADALRTLGDHSVTERLIQLISDEQIERSVRIRIVKTLGSLGASHLSHDLLDLLHNNQLDINVRCSITQALSNLGDTSIVPALLQLLQTRQLDADENIYTNVADTLGKLGVATIAPDLMPLLSDERLKVKIRKSIAQALGTLGNISIVPDLVQLLQTQQLDEHIRASIADTLGKLGVASVASDLILLLNDRSLHPDIRNSIAQALGELGDPGIAPQVINLLADDTLDPNIRINIATTLGKLGDPDIAPQLINLLGNNILDSNVRSYIAQTLGELGNTSIAPQVINLLADNTLDPNVRINIATALGKLNDPNIAPQLVNLLAQETPDAHTNVYVSIVQTLGSIGNKSVIPQLNLLLDNTSLDIHRKASIAVALGKLGDTSVAPQLVKLSSEEALDTKVCIDITTVLGELHAHSVTSDLINLLFKEEPPDPFVCIQVVQTLGILQTNEVITKLVQLLLSLHSYDKNIYSHFDRPIQVSIVSTPDIFDDSSANSLGQLLSDPQLDSYVRKEINHVLDPSTVSDQVQLFSSTKQLFRIAVVRVLGDIAHDKSIVNSLVNLLQTSDIPDNIYEVIWKINQRANSKI